MGRVARIGVPARAGTAASATSASPHRPRQSGRQEVGYVVVAFLNRFDIQALNRRSHASHCFDSVHRTDLVFHRLFGSPEVESAEYSAYLAGEPDLLAKAGSVSVSSPRFVRDVVA